MKKMIPCLLAVAILLSVSVSAIASSFSFDFSPYSDEELIKLETALQKEKIDRGIAKSADIPSGTYTIGEDIPAGVYSIEMPKGQSMGMVTVNEYEAMYVLSKDSPTVGKITLKDGDVMNVLYPIILSVYSGGITFK